MFLFISNCHTIYPPCYCAQTHSRLVGTS